MTATTMTATTMTTTTMMTSMTMTMTEPGPKRPATPALIARDWKLGLTALLSLTYALSLATFSRPPVATALARADTAGLAPIVDEQPYVVVPRPTAPVEAVPSARTPAFSSNRSFPRPTPVVETLPTATPDAARIVAASASAPTASRVARPRIRTRSS
jgi:hypothetical protein